MGVTVRAATKEDVPALVALHKAENDFGGKWFTNPHAGGKQAKYEALTPAQRWLHGGPGMDAQLLALHLDRVAEARGAVLVAERGNRIAGSADLWPAEEPLPLGPYLAVVTLVTDPPGDAGVEQALLDFAVREARARDLRALDIAPLYAGGDLARLLAAGFTVLLEHRTVHIEAKDAPKPPEYKVQSTAPSTPELREFVALDHTEPPSYRIGNLGNEWSSGLLADVSIPFGALLRVDFATVGVTGRVCPWLPEPEAEVDLWVSMAALGNLPWFLQAGAAAFDHVSKGHPAARYRTTVRGHQVPPLKRLGFRDGGEAGPWLRKHLTR